MSDKIHISIRLAVRYNCQGEMSAHTSIEPATPGLQIFDVPPIELTRRVSDDT